MLAFIEGKLEEHKIEFDAKLGEVKSIVDNLVDSRLKCWNQGSASSRGSGFDPDVQAIRRAYIERMSKCLCCGIKLSEVIGRPEKLTTAHIIANMDGLDTLFGMDGSYKDNIKLETEANYLVLCGTQGLKGSCHDKYDNLCISMCFNKELGRYDWVMNDGKVMDESGEWVKPGASFVPRIDLTPTLIGQKYARLLNWRTIRTLLQPGITSVLSIGERTTLINNLKLWEEDESDE